MNEIKSPYVIRDGRTVFSVEIAKQNYADSHSLTVDSLTKAQVDQAILIGMVGDD